MEFFITKPGKYRSRDGHVVTISKAETSYENYIWQDEFGKTYKANGNHCDRTPCHNDIVSAVSEAPKIEAGKFYRTHDGKKAFVGAQRPEQFNGLSEQCGFSGFVDGLDYVIAWKADGSAVESYSNLSLVAEWVEPKRIKGWLNIDADGLVWLEKNREEADKDACDDRIACIEIDVLEGQGLDGSAR